MLKVKGEVQFYVEARLLEQRGFLLMIDSENHPNKCAALPGRETEDGQTWKEQLSVPGCVVWLRLCSLWYGLCAEFGGLSMFPGSPVFTVAVLPFLENWREGRNILAMTPFLPGPCNTLPS